MFTTYFRDSETGLDYAQNRYHDPGDGRFLTPDPYMASGGVADPDGSGNHWTPLQYAGYLDGNGVFVDDPWGACQSSPLAMQERITQSYGISGGFFSTFFRRRRSALLFTIQTSLVAKSALLLPLMVLLWGDILRVEMCQPDYKLIVGYVSHSTPPYLGKPVTSMITALGDQVAEAISCAIAENELSLADAPTANRVLDVVNLAFLVPERILEQENRLPKRLLSLLEAIARVNEDQDVRSRVEMARQRLS